MAVKFLSKQWPDLSLKIPLYIEICYRTEGLVEISQKKNEIRGVGLFTIGTPENNYLDKENGYVLLLHTTNKGLISPFTEIMYKISTYALGKKCKSVLFKGIIDQSNNIKLFTKFANPIKICKNLSGESCILFSGNTKVLIKFFSRYRRKIWIVE